MLLRQFIEDLCMTQGLNTRYFSIAQYDKKAARSSHHGIELSVPGQSLEKKSCIIGLSTMTE